MIFLREKLGLLIIVLCLISGCKQHVSDELTTEYRYENCVDILSDYGHDLKLDNLSTLEKQMTDDFALVMIIPQKTDIISDGPRFFLYRDTNSKEYWIEVRGGIKGDSSGWIGPVTQEYVEKIYESLKQEEVQENY